MSANNVFFKPSFSIENLVNENFRLDSERFLLFLQAYYEWLQTAEIALTGISGTFSRDEIVTGSDTGARAIVKEVKTSSIVVRMQTNAPFDLYESLTGGTSSATATIDSIKDNVVRKTGQLLNYRDATKTVDKYVGFLKDELYSTLPKDIEANKRLVARKYRDFLQNKGNEESYKFLFRTVYDEDIELKYPGEDILRVSDGNFEKTQIIRAVVEDETTIFDFLNQTITGQTSEALGNVVDIKLIYVGSTRVAEITLKLVSGTFDAGERIEIVDTETTNTAIYGMVTGFTINDGGSGYQVGDTVTITSNTGSEALAEVSSIKSSPITAITVNTPGYGYRLNTNAVVTNTGTGGSNFAVRVTEIANTYTVGGYTVGDTATISIINRGSGYFSAPTITLTDTVISSLGLLSDKLINIVNGGTNYAVGDALVFTGGAGSSASGNVASVSEATTYDLLFEDGFRMKADGSYYDIIKNEDWSVTGAITRLELTNFGTGYTSANLPSISVTSGTGSSANLIATGIQGEGANVTVDIANNSAGIGAIRNIRVKNFGVGYESANVNLTGSGDGNANVTAIVSGLGISEGTWLNDGGKIDYKILQDSYYYQDFSYVIRSGLEFNIYSDMIKEIIHPAGLQFFGEILLTSKIGVPASFISIIGTVQNIQQYIRYVETSFSVATSPSISTFKTLVKQLLPEPEGGLFGGATVPYYYGDEPLLGYTSALISSYANTTFDTFIQHIQVNVPIRFSVSFQRDLGVANVSSSAFSDFSHKLAESNFNTSTNIISQRELSVNFKSEANAESNYVVTIGALGDQQINIYASKSIGLHSSETFNDEYSTTVKTWNRMAGFMSLYSGSSNIVGTGTNFNTDLLVNDIINVGNSLNNSLEQFVVTGISNATYMTINVPATYNYTPGYIYK
ncbi:hypothetical protein EBS02_00960 [bacterium]|nr:hypothetical protein [bacterium]